jgi:hypothetical protein
LIELLKNKNMTDSNYNLLKEIYYNIGEQGAYGSVSNILKAFKKRFPLRSISSAEVLNFLEKQISYSIHRKRFKRIARNPTYSPRVNYQWSADLVDLQNIKKYNDDYQYVLVVIDVLSRYLYTEKLTSKSGPAVLEGFKNIFIRAKKLPNVLNTDQGTEFIYGPLQKFLKSKGIHYFTSYGEEKASQAERVIKTLKESFYRYFDFTLNRKWQDKLELFTKTYNANFNRAIKMSPNEAITYPNDILLSQKAFKKALASKKVKPTLKKGDYVRLNLILNVFSKAYEANWSRAIYQVVSGPYYTLSGHLPLYKIWEPWTHEKILGGFLEKELLKVDEKHFVKEYSFPIEKVIKKGPKYSTVRWLGYEKRHDSKVLNSKIKNLASF